MAVLGRAVSSVLFAGCGVLIALVLLGVVGVWVAAARMNVAVFPGVERAVPPPTRLVEPATGSLTSIATQIGADVLRQAGRDPVTVSISESTLTRVVREAIKERAPDVVQIDEVQTVVTPDGIEVYAPVATDNLLSVVRVWAVPRMEEGTLVVTLDRVYVGRQRIPIVWGVQAAEEALQAAVGNALRSLAGRFTLRNVDLQDGVLVIQGTLTP